MDGLAALGFPAVFFPGPPHEHMALDPRLAPIVVGTIRSSDPERQRTVARSKAVPLRCGEVPDGHEPGGGRPAPSYPPSRDWTEER